MLLKRSSNSYILYVVTVVVVVVVVVGGGGGGGVGVFPFEVASSAAFLNRCLLYTSPSPRA